MSDKQSILDDPRMGGTIWNAANEVTEGMLASWPIWETCGDPDSISLAPWVVHPSLREVRAADLIYWRPFRLPGMNESGEIQAKDMRPEFFERVQEWQIRVLDGIGDEAWHQAPPISCEELLDDCLDGEFWRPAIFACATMLPAGTLGDTIDAKHHLTEIRACKDCPCCYTPKGPSFSGDRMIPAPLAACSADPEIVLDDRYLTTRHPDCKMVGKMASWPENNDV